jgi:hypothetical protein
VQCITSASWLSTAAEWDSSAIASVERERPVGEAVTRQAHASIASVTEAGTVGRAARRHDAIVLDEPHALMR